MDHRITRAMRARKHGFTLVELLIVVIILAILAAIVVPQFIASTQDAELAAMDSNLRNMRSAIALYQQQHGEYPGALDSGLAGGGVDTEIAFVGQLVQYTDDAGDVSPTTTATHIYGPYLTRSTMPPDPIKKVGTVVIAAGAEKGNLPLPADVADLGGWKFDTSTGAFIVNITAHQGR